MEDLEQMTQEEELDNYEEEEEVYKVEKSTYFWLVLDILIFGYNSYAITSNICGNHGYFMIVLGLAVNIWVLIPFAGIFETIFPKLNKNFSYILLIAAMLIGVFVGYYSPNEYLEDVSADLVSSIIKEDMKINSLVCESVKINKEESPDVYTATAYLSNGKSIKIKIEDKNKLIRVEFDQTQLKPKESPSLKGLLNPPMPDK